VVSVYKAHQAAQVGRPKILEELRPCSLWWLIC